MKKFAVIIIALLLFGCSTEAGKLTDLETKPEIRIITEKEAGWTTLDYGLDNMDRGNHEYHEKPVVIQEVDGEFTRGAVVLFENDKGDKIISRIVGLPNEVIEVKAGQIFINDKQLDTFYGRAHRAGHTMEEYVEAMDKSGSRYDKDGLKEIFEKGFEKTKLTGEEFFLVSDDWMRGDMLKVTEEQIVGIVLGYKE